MLVGIARLIGYRTLEYQEKGALLDILVELERLRGGFYVDAKRTIPMTDEQIAQAIGLPCEQWMPLKEKLCDGLILKVADNGGTVCPAMCKGAALDYDAESMEFAKWVLGHWNTKNFSKISKDGKKVSYVHKSTPKIFSEIIRISRKLEYDRPTLFDAINNYAKIMKAEPGTYFWNHQWKLIDFIARGVERFSTEADPFSAFRVKQASEKDLPKAPRGRSIMAKKLDVVDYDDL